MWNSKCPFVRFLVTALSLTALAASTVVVAQSPRSRSTDEDLARPLTLDAAIRVALRTQPLLSIARSQLDAARARSTESLAAYFPQITPSYTYSNQKVTVATAGGSVGVNNDSSTTQITLRQTVYDNGRREVGAAQGRASARAAGYGVLDTRQTVILNVAVAYYEVLRRKELVKVQEASVERARTTLEATRAFASVGTVRRIDTLQAEADYDNAAVQLSQARNDVRLAETSLKSAMGIRTPLAVVLAGDPLPRPGDAGDQSDAAGLIRKAIAARPDLRRSEESLTATRHGVQLSKINAGLQIEADFQAGYQFDPTRGDNRLFTTSLSYPLFDGGLVRSRVREAEAGARQAEDQLELARQDVHAAVEQAFLNRDEARMRLAVTESAVRAARANHEAATDGYKEGASTIVDVITARTQLVTAEINAVQAIFDFYVADARLKRAVGDNDPYLTGGAKP